ncbi:MAG: membrane protein insertase YidC [Candidatus Endonucleobacter bathymodioli]|uniref:Membrane protein insertase YidC n=1 Tax=Candidatus Endonucleibacter bathymodioli TaxID=539814 RepID=A0AA90NPC1_9GAMM|nr:membrane protein insertase YidC [Candidatus Endonucleobacter bathymodioli]
MDLQRILLIAALVVVGVFTLRQWNDDYSQIRPTGDTMVSPISSNQSGSDIPVIKTDRDSLKNNFVSEPSTEFVGIKTDTFEVKIDPAGGDIVALALPDYLAWLPKEGEKSQPFQLMQNNPGCSGEQTCVYTAQSALVRTDGPNSNNQRAVYKVEQKYFELAEDQNKLTVNFKLDDGNVEIVKRYTFERGSYEIRIDYLITNYSKSIWRDQFYAQLKRDGSEDPSKMNSNAPMNTYLGAAVRSQEKTYHKLPFDDFKKNKFDEQVTGGYAAILQHYFIGAWIPSSSQPHSYYTNLSNDGKYYFVGFYNDTLVVNSGETVSTGATLYAGPKLLENIKPLAEGLELTVDYGILWFLAYPLFILLHWIQSIVGNWGWSIILLTVLVKAVFYPLNATSFRSMAKMRKLGPKMQLLKEQHKDDRQKMSQAMMELYKKEKVNPMGGCLPIIVQMPVFISLYWVLLESVELRHAPWLGWIQDLAQMDPYFILPLIMGGSMFAQQLLNPTPPDPIQAKVMKFMPVIFTFFFLWFPSGLVLYWVTNNVLSFTQQYIITRNIERDDAGGGSVKKILPS